MRSLAIFAIVSVSLALAGCTSRSDPAPAAAASVSPETTGSIAQPSGILPPSNVGQSGGYRQPMPKVVAPVPAPRQQLAFMAPQRPPAAFIAPPGELGVPVPGQRPTLSTAVVVPEMPSGLRSSRRIYGHRFRDAKPINFGRSSPRKLEVHGVDVSRWQGDIDWDRLRTEGANFAYIKATDGGDHLDPMFKTNWRKAREAGVPRGAYHFFYWCRTAGEQADWFIRNVPREANALPPVIDVEWNHESNCRQHISRARVLEKIRVFADRLERYYGKRPIIYTAPDFYRDNLDGELLEYPFWLRAVAEHPSNVYPGRKWLFWQYSGSGLSYAVEGRIDLNVFHGSGDEWLRWVASR